MTRILVSLVLLGTLVALTTVQSKTTYNKHGEIAEESQTSNDEATAINEGSPGSIKGLDSSNPEKRYYKPKTSVCGNSYFNSRTQVCCCGKSYRKRRSYSCCGYKYHNVRISKCCRYYTVLSKWSKCPLWKTTYGR